MIKIIKKGIKGLLQKIGYVTLPINDPLLKSQNSFLDLQKLIGNTNEIIIFDVGAHFGETAIKFNSLFVNAKIFSFEPFIESYECLEKRVASLPRIMTYKMVLSNEIGEVQFNINTDSFTNSILETDDKGPQTWWKNALETVDNVKVYSTTIDDFLFSKKIDQIDILKLDTQGSEYLIIEGASNSIKNGKIKIVYLEIILMPTYKKQKNFDEIFKLLREKGFQLYDIYNYNYSVKGQLRQIDAIFIHETSEFN